MKISKLWLVLWLGIAVSFQVEGKVWSQTTERVSVDSAGVEGNQGSYWPQLTDGKVEWLGVYSDKLVADVGSQGLWEYAGSSWTQIRNVNPDNTGNTVVDLDLNGIL